MENGDRIKIHEQLATLRTQVEEIRINHLPHIYSKLNWTFGVMISGMVSIILLLIGVIFEKI